MEGKRAGKSKSAIIPILHKQIPFKVLKSCECFLFINGVSQTLTLCLLFKILNGKTIISVYRFILIPVIIVFKDYFLGMFYRVPDHSTFSGCSHLEECGTQKAF